jgi:hypothetical protein
MADQTALIEKLGVPESLVTEAQKALARTP